ncbi:MAG: hypothetical protein ACJAS1_007019, partial [Oleiphilaceae bacterium]
YHGLLVKFKRSYKKVKNPDHLHSLSAKQDLIFFP